MTAIAARAQIGAVRLTVRDLQRTIAFYETVVGLVPDDGPRGTVVLSCGDGQPLIELRANRFARPPDSRFPGLYHLALRVPSRRDLSVALLRLAAHRVGLSGASDHLVSEALYLEDPEGNGLEIYRDRPPDEWPRDADGNLMMATDPLDLKDLADELVGDPPPPAAAARIADGTRVGHVHLRVSDLRSSERFYAGVLGFGVSARVGGALFLAAGGYHHHVGANIWHSAGASPAQESAAGLDRFEIRVPTQTDLAEVIDRVLADELTVEQLDEGALVRDPSGNGVLLTGGG